MKYFFASDVHLGLDIPGHDSRSRQQLFCRWLDMVASELDTCGGALYLLGDIFDFWFEYRRVAPQGFIRTLGRLADMCDSGLDIHFFTGNHDTWTFGYLADETGMTVHKNHLNTILSGRNVMMGHGHRLDIDGIPASQRFLNAIFNNRTAYNIFSRLLHPDAAMFFGQSWSHSNRRSRSISHTFRGEKEHIVRYARKIIDTNTQPPELFIFGHLHTPVIYPLGDNRQLTILGQWITDPAYAVLDDNGIRLEHYR